MYHNNSTVELITIMLMLIMIIIHIVLEIPHNWFGVSECFGIDYYTISSKAHGFIPCQSPVFVFNKVLNHRDGTGMNNSYIYFIHSMPTHFEILQQIQTPGFNRLHFSALSELYFQVLVLLLL